MRTRRRWARISPLSVVALLVFSLWSSGCEEGDDAGAIVLNIRSEILQQDRDILVRLPSAYDSSLAYPTVYVLDGSSLDIPIAETFGKLAAEGRGPKAIVVGIPNMTAANRTAHLTPPMLRTDVEDTASAPGQGDRFLSFIGDELIPFIEQRYRCTGTRAFAGHSRGGLLVIYSLVERPELFQARFCFSAPLWRQEHRLSEDIGAALDSMTVAPSFLYVSVGDGENENILRGFERVRTVLKQHAPAQLIWQARLTPSAVHQDNAELSAEDAVQSWWESPPARHLRNADSRVPPDPR